MPELLEQFMEEHGGNERWITVYELRDHFGLTRYQCNTVSGFLRRLKFGTFGRFPYIVLRIEQEGGTNPSDPKKCRYLVKRKDMPSHALLKSHNQIPAREQPAASGVESL